MIFVPWVSCFILAEALHPHQRHPHADHHGERTSAGQAEVSYQLSVLPLPLPHSHHKCCTSPITICCCIPSVLQHLAVNTPSLSSPSPSSCYLVKCYTIITANNLYNTSLQDQLGAAEWATLYWSIQLPCAGQPVSICPWLALEGLNVSSPGTFLLWTGYEWSINPSIYFMLWYLK